MSKSILGNGRRSKGVTSAVVPGREDRHMHLPEVDTRVELIQALIPIGLEAVNEVLQQEVCQLAGERYSRAGGVPGHARWGVQRGCAVISKSSKIERLEENIDIFDFALSDQEMADISALNKNRRFNDPGHFCEAAFNKFYPIYD